MQCLPISVRVRTGSLTWAHPSVVETVSKRSLPPHGNRQCILPPSESKTDTVRIRLGCLAEKPFKAEYAGVWIRRLATENCSVSMFNGESFVACVYIHVLTDEGRPA